MKQGKIYLFRISRRELHGLNKLIRLHNFYLVPLSQLAINKYAPQISTFYGVRPFNVPLTRLHNPQKTASKFFFPCFCGFVLSMLYPFRQFQFCFSPMNEESCIIHWSTHAADDPSGLPCAHGRLEDAPAKLQ